MTRASSSRERAAGAVLVALHLGAAVALFLAFGLHSYHPTDHGFVVGAAWRVFEGEIPYRDFVWLRPPGTPYLHALALALPETWMLPATRLAYYLEMSAAALLPALWILAAGAARSTVAGAARSTVAGAARSTVAGAARSTTAIAAASLTGLALALHNFPAMAWPTVDGVFAGSVGLAALGASITATRVERRILWRVVASLALFSAALFKQGYAALPAAVSTWALIEFVASASRSPRERRDLVLASIVPGSLLLVAVVGALAAAGALDGALSQLSRASRIEDLLRAGVLAYVQAPHLAMIFVGAFIAHATLSRSTLAHSTLGHSTLGHSTQAQATPAPASSHSRTMRVAAQLALLVTVGWLAARPGEAGHPLFQLLIGTGAVRLFHWLRSPEPMGESARRARALVVFNWGLLALAWGASISWSTQTPLLGLAAAGAALVDLVPEARRRWLGTTTLVGTLLVATAFLINVNRSNPYRDARIARQTADLSEIFPRFGGISTHPGHAERLAELARLIDAHATSPERPFTVLRSFPAIHFLTGRHSPTRLDWYLPLEVRGFQREHLADLQGIDGIVFFQREPYVGRTPLSRRSDAICTSGEFADSPRFLQAVFEAGRVVESTRAFCVVDMAR